MPNDVSCDFVSGVWLSIAICVRNVLQSGFVMKD